jgi:hypothetical protein
MRAIASTSHVRINAGAYRLSPAQAPEYADRICLLDILAGGRADFGIDLRDDPAPRDTLNAFVNALAGNDGAVALAGTSPGAMGRVWVRADDPAIVDHIGRHGLNLVIDGGAALVDQRALIAGYRSRPTAGQVRATRTIDLGRTDASFADTTGEVVRRVQAGLVDYLALVAIDAIDLLFVPATLFPTLIGQALSDIATAIRTTDQRSSFS